VAVNDALLESICNAADAHQAAVEPFLMVGDIIDTCRYIADGLERSLAREAQRSDPWQNGKILRFPK